MEARWEQIHGSSLAQGDLLPGVSVPLLQAPAPGGAVELVAKVFEYDLIVVTQSCDLANNRSTVVSLCPYYTVARWRQERGSLSKEKLKEVFKGRREGIYLVPDPVRPRELDAALMIEMREVHTLPFPYVSGLAERVGRRWRLRTPFLEHFSQAFGRTYTRVGLPDSADPFAGDRTVAE